MFKPRDKVLIKADYKTKVKKNQWAYRSSLSDDENTIYGAIITAKCTGPYYAVRFDDGYTAKIHESFIMKNSNTMRFLYQDAPKEDRRSAIFEMDYDSVITTGTQAIAGAKHTFSNYVRNNG